MTKKDKQNFSQAPLTPFSSGELAGAGSLSVSPLSPVYLTRRVPPSSLDEEPPAQREEFEWAIDAARYANAAGANRKHALDAYRVTARNAPVVH